MFFRKRLRNLDKEMSKSRENIFDSDDNVLITVKATNDEQIFSEYDYDSGEKLNPSLSAYIWEKAKFAPINKDIKLKIYTSNNVCEEEIDSAIRNNYKKDYVGIKREKNKNLFFCLTMLLLGLISLTFLFLSYKFFRNDYVDVIVEIVVWVFFWEAVDAFFLERSEIRHKQIILMKLYSSQIEIVKLDDIKKI